MRKYLLAQIDIHIDLPTIPLIDILNFILKIFYYFMCMSMHTMYVPGVWKSEEVIRYPVTGAITWLLTTRWVLE